MSVKHVRVGEVLQLRRRPVEVTLADEYLEIGVRSFGKGIFHKQPILGSTLGQKRVFEVQPGDLVLSNVFAWEGAIAAATEKEAGRIGSHRFMTYIPIDDRIDTRWAAWFFVSEGGLELIRSASPGSAGRNRTLAIDRFEALEIPLPGIDEQRLVASKLERVERTSSALSELYKRFGALNGAVRAALTASAGLTDEDRRTGGWRTVALGDVLQLACHEVAVEPNRSFNIAGVFSFGRGLFKRGPLTGSETKYRLLHELRRGQVVMSRLKAWEGALGLVSPAFDGWFLSPEFPTFDLDEQQLDPLFFDELLRSKNFWAQLRGSSQGMGARKERVSAERLLQLSVEIPSLSEQVRIRRRLEVALAAERTAAARTEHLGALTPSLLNQAFTGLR